MIKSVRVKNFKCFGDPGATFELAPVTFLFGDNSAGKSTVLQALDAIVNERMPSKDEKQSFFKHDAERVIEIEATYLLDDEAKKARLKCSHNDGKYTTTTDSGAKQLREKRTLVHMAASRPDDTSWARVEAPARHSLSKIAKLLDMAVQREKVELFNALLSQFDINYRYEESWYEEKKMLFDELLDISVPLRHVGAGLHSMFVMIRQLVELNPAQILAIEEPEVHLHPRQLQTLTNVIMDRAREVKDAQIIVECHSDLMLFQIMNLVTNGKIKYYEDAVVHYLERKKDFGTISNKINIDVAGEVSGWPGEIFPWRQEILAEILGW